MHSRRSFLKKSLTCSALSVFPAIIPASARGKNAPSNRIHLGAIAMGGRATSLNMHNFVPNKDVQYLALCDPKADRRAFGKEALEHKQGKDTVSAYTDFRELLARDDIDAVVIATPDHWHVPIALAAAKAGKDMYVEKPLGVSMRWNIALRDAIRDHKNVFQYGTQQRGSGHIRHACEVVRNGLIGEIKHIDVWSPHLSPDDKTPSTPAPIPEGFDYNLWLGPAPEKEYTEIRCSNQGAYHIYDYALGFIAGWGAHPLDVAQWGKGADHTSPVSYEGSGVIPKASLFDSIATWDVQCAYADGVTLRFMSADKAQASVMKYRDKWESNGATFHGTEGWVSISRGASYASKPDLLKRKTVKEFTVRLKRIKNQQRDFLDCIRSRETTVNPVESAIRSDAISHLSDIAIRTQSPVQWDPEKEVILENPAASALLDRPLRAPWTL